MTTPFVRLRRVGQILSALLPALVVAIPPLAFVWEGTYRASITTLGRDQGIFQYIGWAVQSGEVDYRDVRDVNGPLTHLIHMVFLALGSRDEHRFRVLDLVVTGISFALIGACLPGIASRVNAAPSPRFLPESNVAALERAIPRWVPRIGWAGAAWVALSAQYLMYLYWDLAQRESFFDWFLLPSIALGLVAQRGKKINRALLVLVGVLSAIPWFGKPTYIVFTIVQFIGLILDRESSTRLRDRLWPFVLGCALGASTQLAFLWRFGDFHAFLKIYFVDVPNMYRFMLPRTPNEILALQWGGPVFGLSLVTSAVMLGLIWEGHLPKRAFALSLLPLVGFANVLVQAKGFPYHFHPVTAGLQMQFLCLIVWMWERFSKSAIVLFRLVPIAAAAALAIRMTHNLPTSPHIDNTWILGRADTPEQRKTQDYLVYFNGPDFFPWDMREAASYLNEHTSKDDRVQLYGMDPYLLFLAERKSATPFIYSYDLDADYALHGSWSRVGVHPSPEQYARIQSMREEHESAMLDQLTKSPPAAFVFMDKSPLMSEDNAYYDFMIHCPRAGKWLIANYRETASFGVDHVWLRFDVASAISDRMR